AVIGGDLAGHVDDRRLGDAVGAVLGCGDHAVLRGDVDDAPAGFVADLLGQHAAHRGPAYQEHAGHVDRHDVVPFLEAGLGERLAGAHDRVVDDNVEPAGRTRRAA